MGLFDPEAEKVYGALLAAAREIGPVTIEEKKTCVHLVAGASAFAGVHPRKGTVLLNLRTDAPIESGRIRKVERASARRFHNEMIVASPADVDAELAGWLKVAYAISTR